MDNQSIFSLFAGAIEKSSKKETEKNKTGMIIGIVIGVLVVIAIIVTVVVLMNNNNSDDSDDSVVIRRYMNEYVDVDVDVDVDGEYTRDYVWWNNYLDVNQEQEENL